MNGSEQENHPKSARPLHVGMWVCCAVMTLPLLILFAVGGVSGLQNNWGVWVPIALCLGIHGVMFMGKPSHGHRKPSDSAVRAPAKVAVSIGADA